MTETITLPASLRVELPMDRIADFCRRWRVAKLEVFGSVLRDDFHVDSDVDFLISFSPDAEWSLLDEVRMEEELGRFLGREVDLVSRRGIEHSKNWIRRKAILESAVPIYAAG